MSTKIKPVTMRLLIWHVIKYSAVLPVFFCGFFLALTLMQWRLGNELWTLIDLVFSIWCGVHAWKLIVKGILHIQPIMKTLHDAGHPERSTNDTKIKREDINKMMDSIMSAEDPDT